MPCRNAKSLLDGRLLCGILDDLGLSPNPLVVKLDLSSSSCGSDLALPNGIISAGEGMQFTNIVFRNCMEIRLSASVNLVRVLIRVGDLWQHRLRHGLTFASGPPMSEISATKRPRFTYRGLRDPKFTAA